MAVLREQVPYLADEGLWARQSDDLAAGMRRITLPSNVRSKMQLQYTADCRTLRELNNDMTSAHSHTGTLLLATPEAPLLSGDGRVSELVVLLLRHSDAGSQGVMLNRPCFANVGDLLGWGYAELCCSHFTPILQL